MSEKYALITGASRGIGEAIARRFAREGYHLYLTCSNSYDSLLALSKELSDEYTVTCQAFRTDMGNYAQVEELFSHISSLDVLVNNAGIAHMGLLMDMSREDWQHIMDVNLNSCFYTAKFSIPLFLQKHSGYILNISSVWGNVGASAEVAYSASKAGVNGFTKALAKELAPSHIPVNAIACGVIDTSMNHCLSPEDVKELIADIPADRLGKASEIAEIALQLVNTPDYMTGQIITVDGGWY